ncbi:MAG: hypothetical protein JW860_10040 [Sedimentisphaerales bacterium]|nr:hypothetical protein [Sedimentisphaerales bacterium]
MLDLADVSLDEIEPNDTTPGQALEFEEGVLAVGVGGRLSDGNDIDIYNVTANEKGELDILLEITEGGDQDLTSLAVGTDNQVFFVSNNSIWRYYEDSVDIWSSTVEIADAAGQTIEELSVTDIAVTSDSAVLFTLSGRGDIFRVDSDETISTIVTTDEIRVLTGRESVDLVSIAVDADNEIYVADQESGSVLIISRSGEESYTVGYYARGEQLSQTLQAEVFDDIMSSVTTTPRTVIADPGGTSVFKPNSLLYGSGVYTSAGYDVYYVTQLGAKSGGNGTITRVSINEEDPEDVTFTKFFDPAESEVTGSEQVNPQTLNPSALVLDTNGDFGGLMYLGTFGPDMGDEQDGKIFTVDQNGDLSEFVITQYLDPINGETFSGFFDITDMAFSYGGPFGTYLYVLSENDDINGSEEGGYSSDLWRISPGGVAELFVADIADGAITLAFSEDGNISYGDGLYVGTYADGSQIIKVASDGTTSVFKHFERFAGGGFRISDLTFAPYLDSVDSVMEGLLITTIQTPNRTYLFQLEPGIGEDLPNGWSIAMNTGDVSSGDIVFDDAGNLVIGFGGDQNLTQIHYQELFNYEFEDLQVRPVVSEEGGQSSEVIAYVPYTLISIAEQPRIVGLGAPDDPDDMVTEMSPRYLDSGEVPEDGSKHIAFTFDDVGDVYIYFQNSDLLRKSSRNESTPAEPDNPYVEGTFFTYVNQIGGAEIDEATDLTDVQIAFLAWASDASLYALGSNGTEAGTGEGPSSRLFDDQLLFLGYTTDDIDEPPQSLVTVTELIRLQVAVNGPDTSVIYNILPEANLDETLENLTPDALYSISILTLTPSSVDYEMLVARGGRFQRTYIVDQKSGALVLTNARDQQMEIHYSGSGWAELTVDQKPTGKIVELHTLSVLRSGSGSRLELVALDEEGEWALDEIVLDGSLSTLVFPGSVDMLRAISGTHGTVKDVALGAVRDVNTFRYGYTVFEADSLGDPDLTGRLFNVQGVSELMIDGNIDNVTFLNSDSRNIFKTMLIGGIINKSTFYGMTIDSLLVQNVLEEEIAINETSFRMDDFRGIIKEVQVEEGDVVGSTFSAGRKVVDFVIANGNLEESYIQAASQSGSIGDVIVSRQEEGGSEGAGNIINTVIQTVKKIKEVRADGQISGESQIAATGLISSQIKKITTGSDCAAAITSTRVNEVLVGFERNGRRIDEDDSFSGADFTGTIEGLLSIKKLSATGKILGAELSSMYGSISSIFAEDGFIDTALETATKVKEIIVGYLDGKRSFNKIVNYLADVTGSINTHDLGRIYFTGIEDLILSAIKPEKIGPIQDDVATMTFEDITTQEGDNGQTILDITATLSDPSPSKATVAYSISDGSATAADGDFLAASGALTFGRGKSTASFQVTVNGDAIYEPDETFTVDFSNANSVALADTQLEITIENDDNAPSLSIDDVSVLEGDSGNVSAEFTVSLHLDNPTSLPVTVTYATANNTATLSDGDYSSISGTLTFEPEGSLTQTIAVPVNGDTILEGDESFYVNLTNPANATLSDGQGIGTIENDDE